MLVLLLSPFDLVEASIDRAVFPKAAGDWDRIGLFKLKDGVNDRLVLLYYYDSDSVCEKMLKKEGFGFGTSPNVFDIHAVYEDQTGKWAHKKVFGCTRIHFTKVAKVAPDHLILEYRSNFMNPIKPDEDIAKASKRAEEINKPFTKRISLVDGVLTTN
jgi:hypothetical protein